MRPIGYVLLALAVVVLGYEAFLALDSGGYRMIVLGELWFRIDQMFGTASLNLAQAVTQRYLSSWLWEVVIQTALQAPAWILLGVVGLLLWWLGAPRKRRHGMFMR